MAQIDNGPIDTWNWGTDSNYEGFLNIIAPYLKATKICGVAAGCANGKIVRNLSNSANWWVGAKSADESRHHAKARLADGSYLWVYPYSIGCKRSDGSSKPLKHCCANIAVDVNGGKSNAVLGKDIFHFMITKYGVVPWGTPEHTFANYKNLNAFCNIKSTATSTENGFSCTAWIIKNGNMDYLHKNISW